MSFQAATSPHAHRLKLLRKVKNSSSLAILKKYKVRVTVEHGLNISVFNSVFLSGQAVVE